MSCSSQSECRQSQLGERMSAKISFSKNTFSHPYFLLANIIVMTFFSYFRVLSYDFSYVDDEQLILERLEWLSHPDNIPDLFAQEFLPKKDIHLDGSGYYRPLVNLTFAMDSWVYGINAGGYHASNLIFHLLSICILFLFLRSVRLKDRENLLSCLIFSIHPAATHAIAWIPGRTDLLLTLFTLISFLFFSLWYQNRENKKLLIPMVFSLLGAMLCKENGVMVFPFLLAIMVLVSSKPVKPSDWGALLAIGVLPTLIYAFLWHNVWGNRALSERSMIDLINYLPLLPYNYAKLILPHQMVTMDYYKDLPLIMVWLVLPLGVFLWTFKSPNEKIIAGSNCWILMTSTPSLLAARNHILENRLYGLVAPLAVSLVLAGSSCYKQLKIEHRKLFLGFFSLWVLFLTWSTLKYIPAFKDKDSFISQTKENSSNDLVPFKKALFLIKSGKLDEGEALLLKLDKSPQPLKNVANNLGVIYLRRKKLELAANFFSKELARYPGQIIAAENLIQVYMNLGQFSKAKALVEKTLTAHPSDPKLLDIKNILEKMAPSKK